jgi:serine/threonine protein phosphatase PrpC
MTINDKTFCTQCGAENRPTARFCSTCKAPLQPAAPQSPAPHVPPAMSSGMPPVSASALPPAGQAPAPAGYPANAASTTPLYAAAGTATLSTTGPQPARPIRSAAEDVTQTLPTRQNGFSLLPAGALLGEQSNTYEVLKGEVDQPDERHNYLALAWPGQPEPTRYLIAEVREKRLVDRENWLIEKQVPPAGLLLPLASFSQQLWDEAPRSYLIYAEETTANLKQASRLPRPQPLEKVLSWGATLAGGLHALHGKQFAHSQVNPQNILVSDKDARLTGFENVSVMPKNARDQALQLQRRDIAALATSLLDLLGGPRAVLPTEVTTALQRGQGKLPAQPFSSAADFGKALTQALGSLKPSDLKVKEAHATDDGKVRDHNEDNVTVMEKALLNGKIPLSCGIYIVADGMGGHAAGEDASDLAIEAAMDAMKKAATSLQQADGGQIREIVKQACMAANQAVYSERGRRGSDMGTTIVAALRIGDRVAVGNIGDSRAYKINAQEIRAITVDHSLVQRLIDTGQITAAEARSHPQRNLIYKVVGDKPNVEPDVFDVRMEPGDHLLLCSDGLWEMVEDPVIWQTTLGQRDPQAACTQLINLANQAGGEDNITVIIVQAV